MVLNNGKFINSVYQLCDDAVITWLAGTYICAHALATRTGLCCQTINCELLRLVCQYFSILFCAYCCWYFKVHANGDTSAVLWLLNNSPCTCLNVHKAPEATAYLSTRSCVSVETPNCDTHQARDQNIPRLQVYTSCKKVDGTNCLVYCLLGNNSRAGKGGWLVTMYTLIDCNEWLDKQSSLCSCWSSDTTECRCLCTVGGYLTDELVVIHFAICSSRYVPGGDDLWGRQIVVTEHCHMTLLCCLCCCAAPTCSFDASAAGASVSCCCAESAISMLLEYVGCASVV